MVTSAKKPDADSASGTPPGGSVKDSAQQIWLAGLGAFAKAQEEGGKVFETLVKEGLGIQRKTQSAAEEKLSEAASRMAAMANDISAKATGPWDKLENIFEDRVAKALHKLGMPSASDLQALAARVDALSRELERLRAPAAPAATPKAKPAPRRARKTAGD